MEQILKPWDGRTPSRNHVPGVCAYQTNMPVDLFHPRIAELTREIVKIICEIDPATTEFSAQVEIGCEAFDVGHRITITTIRD